jgi:P27 family predicted phage terminase small subunit
VRFPKAAPAPPKHLGAAGKALFRELAAEYNITDAGGLLLLGQAGECLDRLEAARAAIDAQGPMVVDRYGQSKVHPACGLERDARGQLLQATKLLGLDVEERDVRGRR